MLPNIRSLSLVILILAGVQYAAANDPQIELDLKDYDTECGIEVSQHDSLIHFTWPLGEGRRGRLIFDLTPVIRLLVRLPLHQRQSRYV